MEAENGKNLFGEYKNYYLMAIVPIVIILIFIIRFGTNVIYMDEWITASTYINIRENGVLANLLSILRAQDNNHRIVVPMIVQMVIWKLFGTNNKAVMVTSWLIYVIVVGIICKWLGLKKKEAVIYITPIIALVFSFKMEMAYLWGSMIMWPLMILFCTLSFYNYFLYEREKNIGNYIISVLTAIFATWCTANGMLIWITYFIYFMAKKILLTIKFDLRQILLIIVGIICISIYMYGLSLETNSFKATSPVKYIKSCLDLISNPFFTIENVVAALAFGLMAVILLIYLLKKTIDFNEIERLCFPLNIIIFSCLSIAMIAYASRKKDRIK